jgi:hypothetical protein
MLNDDLTNWLKNEWMILEVNNLLELMVSNVGIFFFSHPRAAIAHIQEVHLQFLLGKPDAPKMRIKPWFARSGSKVAYAFMVQTNLISVDQLNSDLEDASTSFPNEYVAWSDSMTLDPTKKVTLIEAHNEHAKKFKLWIATGFQDI